MHESQLRHSTSTPEEGNAPEGIGETLFAPDDADRIHTDELRTLVLGEDGQAEEQPDAELVADNQDELEADDNQTERESQPTTRRGRILRRVADFLQDGTNNAHDKADQADAYASYQPNIQFSKHQERTERADQAKAAVRTVGYTALGVTAIAVGRVGEAASGVKTEAKENFAAAADTMLESPVGQAARSAADNLYFAPRRVKHAAGEVVEAAREKVTSVKKSIADVKQSIADAKITRKIERQTNRFNRQEAHQAATTRRKQRRAQGYDAVKTAATTTGEKTGEVIDINKVRARKFGGNILKFMADARSAGETASENWKQNRQGL